MKTRRQKKDSKTVVTYAETYHAPGLKIKSHCLPLLPSATGFVVVEAYVMKAGRIERGDDVFEFQDVRLYLSETVPA